MPNEMSRLTGAHSVEPMLVVSTPGGLECNDVDGVELHMITKSRRKDRKEKMEMIRCAKCISQFFLFYLLFVCSGV